MPSASAAGVFLGTAQEPGLIEGCEAAAAKARLEAEYIGTTEVDALIQTNSAASSRSRVAVPSRVQPDATPLTSSRPLLLGHRGASKYAPQNTVAAFKLVLDHGCDGFEFDVRYTRDFRPVICHNPLYRRRRIEKHLLSEFSLPCADEVIGSFLGHAFLDIELKASGQLALILNALRAADRKKFVISSFLPDVLQAVHASDNDISLGIICENARQLRRWPSLPIRSVIVERKLATNSLVKELHSADKQVFVWTVNRQKEMFRLSELEVDALISDDTLLLARTFGEK